MNWLDTPLTIGSLLALAGAVVLLRLVLIGIAAVIGWLQAKYFENTVGFYLGGKHDHDR